MALTEAEKLAKLFHDVYEELAPQHGYETREASRKPWDDVPENNKSLMIAVAQRVLDTQADDLAKLHKESRKLIALENFGVDNWEGYGPAMRFLGDDD